jgi:hypothetical protein
MMAAMSGAYLAIAAMLGNSDGTIADHVAFTVCLHLPVKPGTVPVALWSLTTGDVPPVSVCGGAIVGNVLWAQDGGGCYCLNIEGVRDITKGMMSIEGNYRG